MTRVSTANRGFSPSVVATLLMATAAGAALRCAALTSTSQYAHHAIIGSQRSFYTADPRYLSRDGTQSDLEESRAGPAILFARNAGPLSTWRAYSAPRGPFLTFVKSIPEQRDNLVVHYTSNAETPSAQMVVDASSIRLVQFPMHNVRNAQGCDPGAFYKCVNDAAMRVACTAMASEIDNCKGNCFAEHRAVFLELNATADDYRLLCPDADGLLDEAARVAGSKGSVGSAPASLWWLGLVTTLMMMLTV